MRRAGSARPEAIMAEPTRSRASETALSGNPTTVNAGPRRYLHLHVDRPDLDAPNDTVETRWTMSDQHD
jgi:hypothetical protein